MDGCDVEMWGHLLLFDDMLRNLLQVKLFCFPILSISFPFFFLIPLFKSLTAFLVFFFRRAVESVMSSGSSMWGRRVSRSWRGTRSAWGCSCKWPHRNKQDSTRLLYQTTAIEPSTLMILKGQISLSWTDLYVLGWDYMKCCGYFGWMLILINFKTLYTS